ncbi:helix-turn-helix domain-containing protein [Brevibacillus sp. AG162]|uniref:helix-turn-helix domain-containing protein n=1 Tax=Brevibacillus sp. AG162 TaxID=2572910 RepID=UPI00163ABC05|nr:helix-turn-helix transcriptional regulator [Brevibacillus sp. AG162]
MDKAKELGIFIAKAREKSGYRSQRQLSIDSGISTATLSRIESGAQMPTPETLNTLSKYLKATSYEELLERAGILHEDNHTPPSFKKGDPGDELTTIMYHKWDQLDERRRKQALKLIEILEQEADEENKKN